MINARNANCLTGIKGFNSLKEIADETAKLLSEKQKTDEDVPKKLHQMRYYLVARVQLESNFHLKIKVP